MASPYRGHPWRGQTLSTGLPHHFAKLGGYLAHTACDRCVCVCVCVCVRACVHHYPEPLIFGGDRDGFWESSLHPQHLGQLVPVVFLGWGSSSRSTHGKVRIRVSFLFGYYLLAIFGDWGMLQGAGGTAGSRGALESFQASSEDERECHATWYFCSLSYSTTFLFFGFCFFSALAAWRRPWQPTPVFLPGGSHGHRSLAGSAHNVAQSRTRLKRLSMQA